MPNPEDVVEPPSSRVGRPRLDERDETTRVSVSLPSTLYDRVCRRALQQDISVAELIRRRLDERES